MAKKKHELGDDLEIWWEDEDWAAAYGHLGSLDQACWEVVEKLWDYYVVNNMNAFHWPPGQDPPVLGFRTRGDGERLGLAGEEREARQRPWLVPVHAVRGGVMARPFKPMSLDAFSEDELPGHGSGTTTAAFSECRLYRYAWIRSWEAAKGAVVFVMLNPSTADEVSDDPTIRRCLGFARAWGLGELRVGNLFAYRSRDPGKLKQVADPVGPENDRHLVRLVKDAKLVVAAWGTMGAFKGRDRQVRALLPGMCVLGLCKNGQPGHPLYLPKATEPVEWRGP